MTAGSRTAVVTGAGSGIGKATAIALAAQGWRVIAVGRDPARAAAAEAAIRAASTGGDVTMLRADLSRLNEAVRLAEEIGALTPRIDLLVNNAGGMCTGRVVTEEGLEENFAGNHLGPFLLTERLLPLLKTAAADAPAGTVRIVNTSSDASEYIPDLKWDDLQQLGGEFNVGYAYCGTKLANVLHARGLASRLADDGIVAHAYHPGAIDSNFFTHAPADTQERTKDLAKGSVEEGADTLLWLATAEEPGRSSGGYWHKRAPRDSNKLALDDAVVERLWRESDRIVAQVLG